MPKLISDYPGSSGFYGAKAKCPYCEAVNDLPDTKTEKHIHICGSCGQQFEHYCKVEITHYTSTVRPADYVDHEDERKGRAFTNMIFRDLRRLGAID